MASEIRAPLPGVFYRKPSPEEPEFVSDGGSVKAGDVVGLIEVMKSFHEVKAETDCSNLSFKVENEGAVSAGDILAEGD